MTPTLFLFFLFDVRGVVLDPTARPVEGASVACGSETTSTNARGEFELAAGCDAVVSKDGFAVKHVRIGDGRDITLALAPASDRVLVTATGAPVALEEAGVAASVYTVRDFEQRQYPFLQDILRDVPGLSVMQSGANGGLTSVFPRGGDSSTTLVLLDGVPITEPGGALDFAHLTSSGLDRMEVIRGPESALFGAEASSGVIQIFTRHGDPEARVPHGSISYERGSFSTDHWIASLDGGLANRIDYALTADQFRTTGEFANDAFRITTGTANVGYRFSNATSLRAVYRTFDSYTGAPGQVGYGLTDYGATETARDSAVSVRLDDARGSRFVQHVTFGYHRYRDLFVDNGIGGPYNIAALIRTVPATPDPLVYFVKLVGLSTIAPAGTTLVQTGFSLFPGDGLTVTHRTDAGYQGTLTHKGGALVFGYRYERQAGEISATNVGRDNNGFFVHEQYALTPRIFVTGGARVEHSNTFGTEFAPRGAITFRLPTETFLRFSAARGVREPALIENFANETYFVGNPKLRTEKTDSYEAGLSREWLNRRVRTDLSIFRNSFHDLIEFDSSVFPGSWQNINRAWARGGEVSGTVQITRYLAVRAAYTKLYTRITRTDRPSQLGRELVRRPRNSGSLSLELTPHRWNVSAGARFIGERREDDFVFFAINRNTGYEYVYVNASWQLTRRVAPFLRIQNALDEQYQEVLGYSALSRNAIGGVRVTW